MDILVVDNSRLYSQILESELDPLQFTIHYFNNPEHALQAAKEKVFDYICVSYFLEKTDGVTLSSQIRSLEEYKHTPIILFASQKDEKIFLKAVQRGITDVFFKEEELGELVAHINRNYKQRNRLTGRIIFIEDTLLHQQIVTSVLLEAGASVDAYTNAEEAFSSFCRNDYDLVITDIVLEGNISGIKLINMIRRLASVKGEIPILAMSAFDNMSRRVDVFYRGASDYVNKPIVKEEFLARVVNLINTKRLMDLLREQNKTIQAASEQELRVLAYAFESNDAIVIANSLEQIIRTNNTFYQITGLSEQAVIGKSIWDTCMDDISADVCGYAKRQIQQKGEWSGEVQRRHQNGEINTIKIKVSIIKNKHNDATNIVAVLSDVTHEKKSQQLLEYKTYRDPLTGLANRHLLMEQLEKAFIKAQQTAQYSALLFMNLINFKMVNESLGHDIGDLVLKKITERLEKKIPSEYLFARIAGSKFVLLSLHLSSTQEQVREQAWLIAEELREIISKSYEVKERKLSIQSNIGITLFPNGQNSIHDILKQADMACFYDSQNLGVFFFQEHMQELANERLAIEHDLRFAIENEELEIYLQPQFDFTKELIGVEVLLRWFRKSGAISPAVFIPVAEETGLINELGAWVLKQAEHCCIDWHKLYNLPEQFSVSVNVSPLQFKDKAFTEQVKQFAINNPFNPNRLELEITESIFIGDMLPVMQSMDEIRQYGIKISIDDFGTGYSGLSYLTKLPINKLKIDQSFVRDIHIDKSSQTIVETIISMARHLNLHVLAEGVETENQLTFLRQNRCDYFQGYLLSQPLTLEDFEQQYLQDYKRK